MEELKYVDRRNTNCGKWDGLSYMFGRDDLIAMWVADMDFQAPGCVKEAMMHYVEQGVFGYYAVPPSYYDAFLEWEKKHYDFQVEKEWIRFSPGVVAGFSWAIQIMTDPGDAVIVMTPVYYPFMNAIKNNKRKLITCDLKNQKGIYTIDYDNFEKKIEENQVKLFIMCSPHNPVGRVWKKEELSRMLEICKKHHVMVISDEIHQDLTYEGHKNIPALLDEEYHDMLISMTAPSKTFNLAGVQNSIILIANNALRQKWDQFVEGIRVKSGNTFGYIAAEAAYRGGEEWYEAVKCQIVKNFYYLSDTLKEKLPQVVVSPLEGTYLAWVDLRAYEKTEKIKDKIINECKLAVDFGDWFGGERYRGFIRMNLATSFENVVTAVDGLVHCFK